MNSNGLRRLDQVARQLQPEPLPTRHFFAVERRQAAARYGDQTAIEALAAVEEVDRLIRDIDHLRAAHGLDPVDLAILVNQTAFFEYAQDSGAIAGRLVGAFFDQDMEQSGEVHAWSHQRSRAHFEHIIAARLAAQDVA
jgi:hypothetical protein